MTRLRFMVTASDYKEALYFYKDVLGLKEKAAFSSHGGHVTILEAGRATLENADPAHARFIDEVEVSRRVAVNFRVALKVADSRPVTKKLTNAGARLIAKPVKTSWKSLNSRLEAPAGLQLTLFPDTPENRNFLS